MEHRLIQGGEQFLPFARSCVAKLKKLGLPYADQSFEIDGVSIKVRIEPGHEYIRLEGGGLSFLSGATKGSLSETIPFDPATNTPAYQALASFKSTPESRKLIPPNIDGSPIVGFQRNKRLNVNAYPGIASPTSDLQTEYIAGSMYSGKMAKLVQILLGYGVMPVNQRGATINDKTLGVRIKYGYRWALTHGIVTGADGRLWLVEISADRGVIAMLLPTYSYQFKKSAAGIAATKALFQGPDGKIRHAFAPTGESFAADISPDVESGKVRILISPEDMTEFYGKIPHSWLLGWTFNNSGSQALNTCADFTLSPTLERPTRSIVNGYLYRIDFNIGSLDQNGNTPMSAQLTMVETDSIWGKTDSCFLFMSDGRVTNDDDSINFISGTDQYGQINPSRTYVDSATDSERTDHAAPVFVCHIDDEIEVVYMCVTWDKYYVGSIQKAAHSFIKSTKHPVFESAPKVRQVSSSTTTTVGTQRTYIITGGQTYEIVYDWNFVVSTNNTVTYFSPTRRGCAALGARDCYWFGADQEYTHHSESTGSSFGRVQVSGPTLVPGGTDDPVPTAPDPIFTVPVIYDVVTKPIENGIYVASFGTIPTLPDYTYSITTPNGEVTYAMPGEYRGYQFHGGVETWPFDSLARRLSRFVVRYSTLGEELQAVFSLNSKYLGLRHVGSFLSAEPEVIYPEDTDIRAGALGVSYVGHIPAGAT